MVIRHDPSSGHLDPVEVAEHAEGLLATDRASAVHAHLSTCARCQAVAASVNAVTARLAAEPRELPIPDGVAARIDAALAKEAAWRAPEEHARAEGFWSRLWGRMPAIAAATASVAVLGLVGYAIAGQGGGGDAETTADSGADLAEAEEESAEEPLDAAGQPAEEPAAPAEEDSAELDTDDDSADTQLDEAEDGDGEQATTDAYSRRVSDSEHEALINEMQDLLAEQSVQAEPGADGEPCGTVLSEELTGELLGAADSDVIEPGSVLVALDLGDPDTLAGWVLPDCTAAPGDASFAFDVPRPPE